MAKSKEESKPKSAYKKVDLIEESLKGKYGAGWDKKASKKEMKSYSDALHSNFKKYPKGDMRNY